MEDLCLFRNKIFGKYQNQIFIFESLWDTFRPISKFGWNGKELSIVDSKYKQNLFSEWYGFESLEQKQLCFNLIEQTELSLADKKVFENPIDFWKWAKETDVKWFKDRPIVFIDSCVSKSSESWKQYLKYLDTKAKTLRRPFKGRMTRRLVPK